MPPTTCLADFGLTTMVFDPQLSMSSSQTVQGGTLTFMAPELLAPSHYNLTSSTPTQEADIYAFGLVILQVIALHYLNLLVFLSVQLGPDREVAISSLQAPGTCVPRFARLPPRTPYECKGYRDFGFLVGAYSEVLGRRGGTETTDQGSREGSWRCRS
jgi:serine/threonine protein kinase